MQFDGFDWDEGNREKCQKHGLTLKGIEWALSHGRQSVLADVSHSHDEPRFIAICRTQEGRWAFIGFTLRQKTGSTLLRPVTARHMHEKELRRYDQATDLR